MKMMFRTLAVALMAASALACSNGETTRADEIRTMPDEAALSSLQTRLHTDGLLTIPEVKAKSDEFVQSYREGRTSRDAAAKEFLIWVEQWAAENPEIASAAQTRAASRRPQQ